MATNTAGDVAQVYPQNMVHYIAKTITFADNGNAVEVGTIPAGAVILPGLSACAVHTAFDGDTTNTVDIGISGTAEKYASDLALGTLGWIELDVVTEASGNSSKTTAAETILATVVSTASAAAGEATIIMAYVVPDR